MGRHATAVLALAAPLCEKDLGSYFDSNVMEDSDVELIGQCLGTMNPRSSQATCDLLQRWIHDLSRNRPIVVKCIEKIWDTFCITKQYSLLVEAAPVVLSAVLSVIKVDTWRLYNPLLLHVVIGTNTNKKCWEQLVSHIEACNFEIESLSKEMLSDLAIILYTGEDMYHDSLPFVTNFKSQLQQCNPSVIPTYDVIYNTRKKHAWVRDGKRPFSWIEGQWGVDEYQDPALTQQGVRTGGPVSFKVSRSCLVKKIQAQINKSDDSSIAWDVNLASPYNDTHPGSGGFSLEGHWKKNKKKEEEEVLQASTSAVLDWSCSACTFRNPGSATKCSTCNTAAPVKVFQAASRASSGTNPAPLVAQFSSDASFMRVLWSRGDLFGVWYGRRVVPLTSFNLQAELLSSDINTDIGEEVYTCNGQSDNCIVLPTSLSICSSSRDPFSIGVWVRAAAASSTETLFSNGVVSLNFSSGILKFILGSTELLSGTLPVDKWAYILIAFDETSTYELFINGSSCGNAPAPRDADSPKLPFVIGGIPVGLQTIQAEGYRGSDRFCYVFDNIASISNCFSGALCELKVWNEAIPIDEIRYESLQLGSRHKLVGHWTLIGSFSSRFLIDNSDSSRHHGSLFRDVKNQQIRFKSLSDSHPLSVMKCPVKGHFTRVISDFLLAGAAEVNQNVLQLNSSSVGEAMEEDNTIATAAGSVWYSKPLALRDNLFSEVYVDTSAPHLFSFVLCQSSFWELGTYLDIISGVYSSTAPSLRIDIGVTLCDNAKPVFEIGLGYYSGGGSLHQLGRYRRITLHGGNSSKICFRYLATEGMLQIQIDDEIIVENALQLEAMFRNSKYLFLGLASSGVIGATTVSNWIVRAETRHVEESSSCALYSAYSLVQADATQKQDSDDIKSNGDDDSKSFCTKVGTDNSPILQEGFTCFTCDPQSSIELCALCAAHCHEHHEIVLLGKITFTCACSHRGGLHLCRSREGVLKTDVKSVNTTSCRWKCSSCTMLNGPNDTVCSVCGASSKLGSPSTSELLPPLVPSNELQSSSPSLVACGACTMLNQPDATTCVACSGPMATAAALPLATTTTATTNGGGEWTCKVCTSKNSASLTRCSVCDSPRDTLSTPPSAANEAVSSNSGRWTCQFCTIENDASATICSMCSSAKPVSSAIVPAVASTGPVEQSAAAAVSDVASALVDLTDNNSSGTTNARPAVVEVTEEDKRQLVNNRKRKLERCSAAAMENMVSFDFDNTDWDLTCGLLVMTCEDDVSVGEVVSGWFKDGSGYVNGIAYTDTDDSGWKLSGQYQHTNQSLPNAFNLNFPQSGKNFDGFWYRGDGSGEWKCNYEADTIDFRGLSSDKNPFVTGLVNMKDNLTNVCYQNSFLQPLFMTHEFRNAMISASRRDGLSYDDLLFESLRRIFGNLSLSQRVEFAAHELQRHCSMFLAGHQQDASDFAHFIMEQLDHGFQSVTTSPNALQDIFGGQQSTLLRCNSCEKVSVKSEYFWELHLNLVDLRYTPITGLTAVSGSQHKDIKIPTTYERMNFDLNRDRDRAPYTFLCVQRKAGDLPPITDLTIKVVNSDAPKPIVSGYDRVELDLNSGGVPRGKQVYLFTKSDPSGSPITDLHVLIGSDDKVPDGFRKINVDLNQGQGTVLHLCYRCDMPCRQLLVVPNGVSGFTLLPENLSLDASAPPQYVACNDGGTDAACITDLCVAKTIQEREVLVEKGWEMAGYIQSTEQSLMLFRGHGNPCYDFDVIRSPRTVPKYQNYEVLDLVRLSPDFAKRWRSPTDTECTKRSVILDLAAASIPNVVFIEGSYYNSSTKQDGKIEGILVPTTGGESSQWKLVAHFHEKNSMKFPSLLSGTVVSNNGVCTISGSGTFDSSLLFEAKQLNSTLSEKSFITDLALIGSDEAVPEGYDRISSGKSSCNLLSQGEMYLYVKYSNGLAESEAEGVIVDIKMIYENVEQIPDGYIPVRHSIESKHSGNLLQHNDSVPLYMCYRKIMLASSDQEAVLDVGFLTSNEKNENFSAYKRITTTPMGMPAKIAQQELEFCFKKGLKPSRTIEHSVNGEYGTVKFSAGGAWASTTSSISWESVQLKVKSEATDAYSMTGTFGAVYTQAAGKLEGYVVTDSKDSIRKFYGCWDTFSTEKYACSFTFASAMDEASGWWSRGSIATTAASSNGGGSSAQPAALPSPTKKTSGVSNNGGTWIIKSDTYVLLAYKKDFGTEWKNGHLAYTERISSHEITSMLSRFVSPKTLGGDNSLDCDVCERKTERTTETIISSPPKHLILTLKRMWYDQIKNKTMKSLHDVSFPARLELPRVPDFDESVSSLVFNSPEDAVAAKAPVIYGLYGMLVHAGATANSGHYFSFTRECKPEHDSTLQLENSPNAPWLKMNDSKISFSNWEEMNASLRNSVSDSVYLLFYKKLSLDGDNCEDEEMLMARAMSLSMSTTTNNTIGEEQSLVKEVWDDNVEFWEKKLVPRSSRIYVEDMHEYFKSQLL